MDLIYKGKVFKQFRDTIYYVSIKGDVYSDYAKRIIKCLIRISGGKQYKYIDVWDSEKRKQQHVCIHRMVYIAWVRELKNGEQVNHINDNSLDNRLVNLYVGNQKQNIKDCFNNNHRVGNVFYLTLIDRRKNKTITFCPANKFIEYSGHTNKSGSLNKFFNKNWFKERYEIVEFKRIKDLRI